MHKDENLSKWFKKFLSGALLTGQPLDRKSIVKWGKQHRNYTNIIGKDGLVFRKEHLLVRDYYRSVVEQAVEYPGKTEVLYVGTVEIQEIKRYNGTPRIVPDKNGGFHKVVEDHFNNLTHYVYVFRVNRNKIKRVLRPYIQNAVPISILSKYLKLAYKLYPDGNFYKLNK